MESLTTGDSNELERSESLRWSVRLSDNAPWKRWVVLAVAVTAGLIGGVLLGQPTLGLAGFLMILGATAEFWLGVHYKVTGESVSRRCGLSVSAMEWEQVKRVLIEGDDVKISPLAEATKMDPFRGVTLKTLPDNRERVIAAVRRHIGEDVRILGL